MPLAQVWGAFLQGFITSPPQGPVPAPLGSMHALWLTKDHNFIDNRLLIDTIQ